MEELRGVELLPEPGEPKILSAVDPSTNDHQDQWRAEVTGWAPTVPDGRGLDLDVSCSASCKIGWQETD